MPLATLDAFDDYGNAQVPPIDTKDTADDLAGVDLRAAADLERITTALEREGVEAFSNSYEQLIDCIREKTRKLSPGVSARSVPGRARR